MALGRREPDSPSRSTPHDQQEFAGRSFGKIATLAAVSASLGDLALLYVANARRPELALPPPPVGMLLAGFYLGVLALPLYGLGYWRAASGLRDPAEARHVFVLGALGGALGAVVHGVTAHVIRVEELMRAPGADPLAVVAQHGAFLLPLWCVLAVMTVAGSTIYAKAVLAGRSAYPRWMAFLNPALLLVVTSLVALPSLWLRAFLLPAAANLVHVAFFATVGPRSGEGAS
jgi:hypothetical protein